MTHPVACIAGTKRERSGEISKHEILASGT